jgi:hypothetical protein
MRTQHISVNDAVRGLANIVRKFGPDHVAGSDGSAGCTYGTRDEFGYLVPVCIVGQFIHALGFLGALVEDDTGDQPGMLGACTVDFGNSVWNSLGDHGLTFDEEAKTFLYTAQNAQDGNADWGTSLLKAYREVGGASAVDYGPGQMVEDTLAYHKVPASAFL